MRPGAVDNFIAVIGLSATVFLTVASAEARKIRTKNSIPKTQTTAFLTGASGQSEYKSISMASDSIIFCDSIRPAIRFYGFDKTVTSNIESFFISNGLDEEISAMEIDITYTDIKGRQLHKRTVSLDSFLPPGETRRFDIKSWDIQKSFYFHQSVKPKRQATPFDVKIELLSIELDSRKYNKDKDPE